MRQASPLNVRRIYLPDGPHPCTGTTTHREDYLPASPHRLPTTTPGPALGRLRSTRELAGVGRLASAGSAWGVLCGDGEIKPLFIDYARRPRPWSPLTPGGFAWARDPLSFRGGGRSSGVREISPLCPPPPPVAPPLAPASPGANYPAPEPLGLPGGEFLPPLSLLIPAFSPAWRPRLDPPPPSPATRRSPTHPHTW